MKKNTIRHSISSLKPFFLCYDFIANEAEKSTEPPQLTDNKVEQEIKSALCFNVYQLGRGNKGQEKLTSDIHNSLMLLVG